MIKEHYYATVPGVDVSKAERAALSQESEILAFMTKRGGNHTAWTLAGQFPTWEITSIRRALFNLREKDGKIEQIGWVPGPRGHRVGSFRVIYSLGQGKLF